MDDSVVTMFQRVQQYLEAVRELQAVANDKAILDKENDDNDDNDDSISRQLAASAQILRDVGRELSAIRASDDMASLFQEQTDFAYRTYREAKSRLESDEAPDHLG